MVELAFPKFMEPVWQVVKEGACVPSSESVTRQHAERNCPSGEHWKKFQQECLRYYFAFEI